MAGSAAVKASERRAEHILNDLLISQGWDLRRPPQGNVLYQHEYRAYTELMEPLLGASKTASGPGVPEAIIVDRSTIEPLAVVEAKRSSEEIAKALDEAQSYALAFIQNGYNPLAIGLAGTSDEEFALRVSKWNATKWVFVTYDRNPINWIPTLEDLGRISIPRGPAEIRPTIPPPEVLAERAEEINRLLRESDTKDEYRPATVAAIMLALWNAKGEIRRDPRYILRDINDSCRDAFIKAGKSDLAKSLRVDEANDKLKDKARRIARILERLNVTVLTAEHDYLGQLYETFFRYTGGNTIGQYFTPRHIARMMADICGVTKDDVVLDPTCGSGGFLVACMDRILVEHRLSRQQMVSLVKTHLIGFESEPVTAALCVANMILRGDGSTGVHRNDCFTAPSFPVGKATISLMNPPFPHKKTDAPAEKFVDRALEGLVHGGKMAVILPTSLLVKKDKGVWRRTALAHNSLIAVCELPNELFQPFASATTSIVFFEKGVPHNERRKTVFVRLNHDGLTLKKSARVYRPNEPNQVPDAIDSILNKKTVPGFSGAVSIKGKMEWAVGAYIPSAPPEDEEVHTGIDVLLRRHASFYTRYAPEIIAQREAIKEGDLVVEPYRKALSSIRLATAFKLPSEEGTIGGFFDIFYGMKELHSREGIAPGRSLIISPTEEYNGCYGWLGFRHLVEPPFITVASTGSIGEAFVQLEPCAVNDDCLILLPKKGQKVNLAQMFIVAATLQIEKWRFTYGRKLTPSRIAEFKISTILESWVSEKLKALHSVIDASLAPYQPTKTDQRNDEDDTDYKLAQKRLDEIERNPKKIIRGSVLKKRLAKLER